MPSAGSKDPYQIPSTRAFVSVLQAAELLRVGPETIRRRCRSGSLLAIRSGRQWRVEFAALCQSPHARQCHGSSDAFPSSLSVADGIIGAGVRENERGCSQ